MQHLLQNSMQLRDNFFQFILDSDNRLPDIHESAQVNRGADHDKISRRTVYRLLQLVNLLPAVTHCRKKAGKLRPFFECIGYTPDCIGPGIDELCGTLAPGRNDACSIQHISMPRAALRASGV